MSPTAEHDPPPDAEWVASSRVKNWRRGVCLKIGHAGLTYRPLAQKTVPWPEITEILALRAYVDHERQPDWDRICFSVVDETRYPWTPIKAISRWINRARGLPAIVIPLRSLAGAQLDATVQAIEAHWGRKVADRGVYWSQEIWGEKQGF
jgi:hypothetical protein